MGEYCYDDEGNLVTNIIDKCKNAIADMVPEKLGVTLWRETDAHPGMRIGEPSLLVGICPMLAIRDATNTLCASCAHKAVMRGSEQRPASGTMDSAKDNTNAMGCHVQRGLSNVNVLNALHQRNSDVSLQLSGVCSYSNGSCSSSSFAQESRTMPNTSSSTLGSFTNSSAYLWNGEEQNRSAFLGGYPMLPSNDPLFRAFSPCTPTLSTDANGTVGRNTLTDRNPLDLQVHDSTGHHSADASEEIFARKVFIGGLPFDVSQAEIVATFSQFGPMVVDWPYRSDCASKIRTLTSSHPARSLKGYVFIVFEEERSVQHLVKRCHRDGDDYYLLVSSPTMRNKPVQVRPWRLADITYKLCGSMSLDPRRTVFIGGVPRPTKASDLARVLEGLYGPVCYAGIDIDPELKYPKGAARVTFATTAAFISAINGRFVNIFCGGITKRVEIKPYIMDEQMCDECYGARCSGKYAPYFCGDVLCLQYFCEECWIMQHSLDENYASHRPLVRLGDQIKVTVMF
ncbi:unnamed protein product [Toxocara canis]|uniref:Cytoplasmic polyadenylation element-binding protein 1 n=1 Tax=Toxocara canis TaxID=6265 RepID=A0A183V1J7_TOXCA|nr:unnamed protein product [Toxocara canis]